MPTETISAPGTSLRQKLLLGSFLACAPCCSGSGGGSGSGSDGGTGLLNCCGEHGTLSSITFSYELAGCSACGCENGTGGDIDGGACDIFGGEFIFPEDTGDIDSQAGIGTFFNDCSSGGITRQMQISLCCYTRLDSSSFFQVNAIYSWFDGVTHGVSYKYRVKIFDAASCLPFSAESDGVEPFETIIVGTPCECTPPTLAFSMSGSF